MTDLTLKPTFVDRGGKQVYDVVDPSVYPDGMPFDERKLGTARLAPDPRIKELEGRPEPATNSPVIVRLTKRIDAVKKICDEILYDGSNESIVWATQILKALEEGK